MDFVQIFLLPHIIMKDLMNCFPGNVPLILHQLNGHSMVSGHQFKNCCNNFLISSRTWLPTPQFTFKILTSPSESF